MIANQEPRTPSADLIERLLRTHSTLIAYVGPKPATIYVNPDGPEAAARIKALEAIGNQMAGFIEGLSVVDEASPEFLLAQAAAFRTLLASTKEGE